MAVLGFGSNVSSLLAQRMLARSSSQQAASFERLSSGMRINHASDDAVGLAIADKLGSDRRLFGTAIRNVNDAISMLNIASDAQSTQSTLLSRLAELAEQSANGVYTNQQRTSLNAEYQKLLQEFGRIGSTTTFNGLNLLSGGRGQSGGNSVTVQSGITGSAQSSLSIAIADSGAISGTVAFSQLATYGKKGSMTDQELNDFYGSNVLYTTITDSSGRTRQIALALTRGLNGSVGQQNVEVQIYQRVSDTGGAGASTAIDTVESASDTWVRGGTSTLTVNASGRILNASNTTAALTFQNNTIAGQASVDLRGLQFAGNIAGYSDMVSRAMASIQAAFGVGTPGTGDNLYDDLGADSLSMIDLVGLLEEDFSISLSDGASYVVNTVGDVLGTLAQILGLNDSSSHSAIDFSGVDTQGRARVALDAVRARQADLASSQGTIGASQSRLERTLSLLSTSRDTYAQAESRIRDVDVAQETAKLIAAQTAQQAGAAVLASANNQPTLLLSLLRL